MSRYRSKGKRTIDPRDVQTHVRSEAAVQGYMANPDWSGPDRCGNGGFPAVRFEADGTKRATVGNHRIEAAKRKGRKIRVEVYEPRDQPATRPADQPRRDTYFAWMWGG